METPQENFIRMMKNLKGVVGIIRLKFWLETHDITTVVDHWNFEGQDLVNMMIQSDSGGGYWQINLFHITYDQYVEMAGAYADNPEAHKQVIHKIISELPNFHVHLMFHEFNKELGGWQLPERWEVDIREGDE